MFVKERSNEVKDMIISLTRWTGNPVKQATKELQMYAAFPNKKRQGDGEMAQ